MIYYSLRNGGVFMDSTNLFSDRIKELRKSLNLTQAQFAQKIGTTQVTLSSYENSDKTPALETLKKIAVEYGVSVDWLLGLSDVQYLSSEISTYSDLISTIVQIEKIKNLCLEIDTGLSEYYEGPLGEFDGHTAYNIGRLGFNDELMTDFISEWSEMIRLRNRGTIKEDLYNLWVNDKIKSLQETKISTDNQIINPDF